MKTITKYIIVALSVLATFAFLDGSNVSASSAYDDVIKLTDSLKVESPSGEVDVTSTYGILMASGCGSTYYDSFMAAVNNGGDWAIVNHDESAGKRIRIIWSPIANSLTAQFASDSPAMKYLYLSGLMGYAQFGQYGHTGSPMCDYATTPTTLNAVVLSMNTFASDEGILANTYSVNYPSGYSGVLLPSPSADTDGDGLRNYIESQWYPGRDDIFCGTQCAYPNPVEKDLYVELDWMKDGFDEYKPSSTQLNLVKDMFEDKNINFHIDTGQFGGGNELATYTASLPNSDRDNEVDAGDYKLGGDGISANFSTDRESIWHYMIAGNQYIDGNDTGPSGSSGWAEVLGDQSFIAMGIVENASGVVSVDRAVANSIAHELGHNLCLDTTQYYIQQPEECVYSGIDNSDSNDAFYHLLNYESVMNYRYQLTDVDDMGVVDYSNGSHGSGDHDDWTGVMLGMGGFSGERTEIGMQRGWLYPRSPDGTIIAQ